MNVAASTSGVRRTACWCARLFNLAFLVGLSVMWAKSHLVSRGILFPHRAYGPELQVESENGQVYVSVILGWPFEECFRYTCVRYNDDVTGRASLAECHHIKAWHGFALQSRTHVIPPLDPHLMQELRLAADWRANHPAAAGFSVKVYGILVPYWFLFLLSLIPPLRWTARLLANWRHKLTGRCPNCGYNLFASPERCPECGTNVKRTQNGKS